MSAPLLLTVALLLSQDKTIFIKQKLENPVLSKQKEKQDLIEKLKRDIFKVNRSLGETDKLIAKSRNAPYLPDLMFRQAELYVEKSRYTYYLQAETRPEGAKGAMVSPETKLLKQRAQQIYNRILRDFPEFKDGDKVTFYLAHEQRELGEFDNMLKTLGDLIRKYPSSPLRLDSEQIIGDYWFDKSDLKQAEEHYKNIPRAEQPGARPRPLQDGVDSHQRVEARRRGHLLRGRRRLGSHSRRRPGEVAQRQARGAARPGLFVHRGPPRQGRAAVLREAV